MGDLFVLEGSSDLRIEQRQRKIDKWIDKVKEYVE